MIFNMVSGGGSQPTPPGSYPSLFVTGLEETDTCTATCNGKTFNGVWTSKGRLPSEYQEVEYIESSGTQYIDTGIYPTKPLHITTDVLFTSRADGAFVGIRYNTNYGLAVGINSAQSRYNWQVLNGSGSWTEEYSATTLTNQWYSIDYTHISGQFSLLVDGREIVNSTNPTQDTTYNHIALFGFLDGTNFRGMPTRMRNIKIEQSDNLVRDFIPCYRKSDNIIGMYDTVNDVFYTNAGSGSFTKGADINTSGFLFSNLTELGTYTVSDGTSTMAILIDAPIEYTLEWSTIPRNGLVAEYLFDGDTMDSSPNGNDLTNSGVTFSNNMGVFSGSAYAQASNGVIPTNSNPFSVSACFKTTSTAEYQTILTNGYLVSDNGFDIRLQNGQVHAFTKGANVLSILSTKTYNDGVWHNVVVTNTGDTTTNGSKMYVDGEFITSGTMSTPITSTVALLVGRTNYSAQYQYFAGSLDNIRIYNRVLTDVEIEALYGEAHQRTYLYKEGDECSDVTGGYGITNYTLSSYTLTQGTKETNNLHCIGSSGRAEVFGTANLIDFSGYETINIDYVNESTSATGGYIQLLPNKTLNQSYSLEIGLTSKTRETKAVALSETSKYLAIYAAGVAHEVRIYNIWLE